MDAPVPEQVLEKLVSLKLKMCQVYNANQSVLFTKILASNEKKTNRSQNEPRRPQENEHLKFEDHLKKITLRECIDWIAEAWDEITPKTRLSQKKLVDHLPDDESCPLRTGEAARVESCAEFGNGAGAEKEDVRQLVVAIDGLAGTVTSKEEFEMWLRDWMYDADNNPAQLTSEIFFDEDILDSMLNVDVDPVPREAELGESVWMTHRLTDHPEVLAISLLNQNFRTQ